MNKTNKILVWVVALLAILNLTTIGTIIYHNYHEKKSSEKAAVLSSQGNNPLNGRFFRQEMNFDDNQMEKFREVNHPFQSKADALVLELDSLKHLMFDELNKLKVDTQKINDLSKEIGVRHAVLKQETNMYYLNLKNICNLEQKAKLQTAFQSLFYQDGANERMQTGNGRMYRHRHGRGYGNGQNKNQ